MAIKSPGSGSSLHSRKVNLPHLQRRNLNLPHHKHLFRCSNKISRIRNISTVQDIISFALQTSLPRWKLNLQHHTHILPNKHTNILHQEHLSFEACKICRITNISPTKKVISPASRTSLHWRQLIFAITNITPAKEIKSPRITNISSAMTIKSPASNTSYPRGIQNFPSQKHLGNKMFLMREIDFLSFERCFWCGGFNYHSGKDDRDAWDLIFFAGEMFVMKDI